MTPTQERLHIGKNEKSFNPKNVLKGVRGLLYKTVESPVPTRVVIEDLASAVLSDAEDDTPTIETVYDLDAAAEQFLQEVETKQYINQNEFWATVHAWDASRTELAKQAEPTHIDALMRAAMKRTGALSARQTYDAAYSNAKVNDTLFIDEFEAYTEIQRRGEKERLSVG